MSEDYPWYRAVEGDELVQGDILEDCYVFSPPESLAQEAIEPGDLAEFRVVKSDFIVMTQTCDIVLGREKVDEALLCPLWKTSEIPKSHPLGIAKGMEKARQGQFPSFHVLAESELPGLECEVRVVNFRTVNTLPLEFLRSTVKSRGKRCRLMPPYREHLAQGFARFFMRVGLPVDIPSFA